MIPFKDRTLGDMLQGVISRYQDEESYCNYYSDITDLFKQ